MARSRKKNPISGVTTARSEKLWKRFVNRKLRQKARILLAKEAEILPENVKEVSNVWDGPKDGRVYWGKDGWPWWPLWKILRK